MRCFSLSIQGKLKNKKCSGFWYSLTFLSFNIIFIIFIKLTPAILFIIKNNISIANLFVAVESFGFSQLKIDKF